MTTCKQLEESYIDYVCDLLDEEGVAVIEEHLWNCSACVREVESLKKTLTLTEAAGTISTPDGILDDIEVKVYKRLAVESPQSTPIPFFSRIFGAFSFRQAWIWRVAAVTCVLTIGIPIVTIFFNQDESADVSGLIPTASAHERIEEYKQQELQYDLENALAAWHLKDDERAAAGEIRRLTEKVRGTSWEPITEQFQSKQLASKGGI